MFLAVCVCGIVGMQAQKNEYRILHFRHFYGIILRGDGLCYDIFSYFCKIDICSNPL